jgi:hypothetical protein
VSPTTAADTSPRLKGSCDGMSSQWPGPIDVAEAGSDLAAGPAVVFTLILGVVVVFVFFVFLVVVATDVDVVAAVVVVVVVVVGTVVGLVVAGRRVLFVLVSFAVVVVVVVVVGGGVVVDVLGRWVLFDFVSFVAAVVVGAVFVADVFFLASVSVVGMAVAFGIFVASRHSVTKSAQAQTHKHRHAYTNAHT